jgi:hypothetical protein
MTERRRLPNRRPASSFDLEVAGLRYKVTAGYFPDGSLAEIFLSSTRTSSQADVAAHDLGVLVSLCLQHGCPAETIAHALARNSNGSASGVIGAVLDLLAAERVTKKVAADSVTKKVAADSATKKVTADSVTEDADR